MNALQNKIDIKDKQKAPVVLSIAGLDPSAGAGLYADIKTFCALNVWGMGIPSTLTNQTAKEFVDHVRVPDEYLDSTLFNILNSYKVAVLKIGLLTSSASLDIIVRNINKKRPGLIVLDPIIFSSTGFRFWDEDLMSNVIEKLMPSVDIITPNMKEAVEILEAVGQRPLKDDVSSNYDKKTIAQSFYRVFRTKIALTGGDVQGDSDVIEDVFYDGMDTKHRVSCFVDIPGHMKHGTGCSFSSALASYMALGHDFMSACFEAGIFVENAINNLIIFGDNDGGLWQNSISRRTR
jgi:hydroxymethylpyrimidine kinase/phosphomethylpyrimidine kinase